MASHDTGAQLLASNLRFLLEYLAPNGAAPQPRAAASTTGGALFLTAVAQKREGGL